MLKVCIIYSFSNDSDRGILIHILVYILSTHEIELNNKHINTLTYKSTHALSNI